MINKNQLMAIYKRAIRLVDALWTQVTQTDGSVHYLLCEYIALQTYDDFVSYGYFQ